MHYSEHCIFCQIIQGKSSCYKVHEDELTMTMLDIFPSAPGHLLILTKEHYADIFAAKPEAIAQVAVNSVRLAHAINTVFSPDGLGVYQLNKPAAGQTVFHYHMHLIPKMDGEGIGIHSKSAGDSAELSKHAEWLRKALAE